jgi:hypothetical protein
MFLLMASIFIICAEKYSHSELEDSQVRNWNGGTNLYSVIISFKD